jgi:hypothetical protein
LVVDVLAVIVYKMASPKSECTPMRETHFTLLEYSL